MASRSLDSFLDPAEFDSFERYPPPNPEENSFDEKPEKRQPDYYCLARGRYPPNSPLAGKWKYCYARAGAGTNHKGFGRCMNHGGSTSRTEQRYATLLNPAISEKIAKHLMDPNPLDLRAELAAGRALFEDFIERHEEFTDALLAWRASFEKSKRGLHDLPLYNIKVMHRALKRLGTLRAEEITLEALHGALEWAVVKEMEDRVEDGIISGRRVDVDLYVEKPQKVTDIAHAARLLKTIQELASAIIKHEREAFLSIFAVQALIEYYSKATRRVITRRLRKLQQEQEVRDVEEIADLIIGDIDREWQRAPVIENSVPRLAAERREQDQYLGPGSGSET